MENIRVLSTVLTVTLANGFPLLKQLLGLVFKLHWRLSQLYELSFFSTMGASCVVQTVSLGSMGARL